MTEWSIRHVAQRAGTTTRALRHYDAIGILHPSRVGAHGHRFYDAQGLVRLQRILLLRELGLGLPAIADVLAEQRDPVVALLGHIAWLEREKERLTRQIAAVASTITALEEGEMTMTEKMFDGFDHAVYREEVAQRWGEEAAAHADEWWTGKSPQQQSEWMAESALLAAEWSAAAERATAPDSVEARALAARHVDWLRSIPGTPAARGGEALRQYVLALAEMYVDDERFAVNYATSSGGTAGAEFVRDALVSYTHDALS